MQRIDKDRLALSLRKDVSHMVEKAALPPRLSWPKDVTARDMAASRPFTGHMVEGQFEVRAGGATWVFDGEIDADGFEVNWNVEIEPVTGSVFAVPSLRTTQVDGPQAGYEALGLTPRYIGLLGPLEPMLPTIEGMSEEYSLPNIYGRVAEARKARKLLGKLCKTRGGS